VLFAWKTAPAALRAFDRANRSTEDH